MPSEFLKAGGGLKSALRSGLPHPKGKRTLLSALGSSFEPELLGAGRSELRTHVVPYLVGDRSWDMPLPPHPGHMLPLCPPHQRPLLPQAPTAAPPTCLSWGLQPSPVPPPQTPPARTMALSAPVRERLPQVRLHLVRSAQTTDPNPTCTSGPTVQLWPCSRGAMWGLTLTKRGQVAIPPQGFGSLKLLLRLCGPSAEVSAHG